MLNLLSKLWSGLLPRRRRYLDAAQYNVHPPDLTFLTDVAPGRWVESALDASFATVGSLVPGGYDAYARLLHPARDASYNPVRWSAVAEWSGRVYHPLMSFEGISLPADGYGNGARPWDDDPQHGSLDEAVAMEMESLLSRFTTTPDLCCFGVWEGYGQYSNGGTVMLTADGCGRPLRVPRDLKRAQRIKGVGRNYLLYQGRLEQIAGFYTNYRSKPPNIWWPADRAWFVATDIDLDSTYVGGSVECIEALLGHDVLEAVPANREASVAMTADAINLGDQS